MLWVPLLLLHAAPARLPVAPELARFSLTTLADGGEDDAGALDGGGDGGPTDAGSVDPDAGLDDGGGSTGTSLGNQTGDEDQDTVGIPSRCNSDDDCPLYFNCVSQKCRPQPQNPNAGGCGTGGGLQLVALLTSAGLFFRRRRPAT